MRKLRAAIVGMLLALPAALVLPGAVPAAASMTTCPGTINLNQSFGVSVSPLDKGANGGSLTITGNGFPALTTFSNGYSVYFTDGGGNQTVHWTGTVSPDGSSITGPAASNGYSGLIEVCLNGDSYQAKTQPYSYVPAVSSVPARATEGSTITLGGKFIANASAQVHFSCGTVGASSTSLTTLAVAVPGYCPGQISVTQTAIQGGATLNGQPSSQSLAIQPTISPSSMSPTSSYPGQTVTVSGSGFGGGGSVSVGGAGASVSSWSDNQVSFQAPDGSEGGTVTISAPGGSDSADTSLSILPHISSLSPSTARDGDTVTIDG